MFDGRPKDFPCELIPYQDLCALRSPPCTLWLIGRERHRVLATEDTEENREVEELGPMPRGRWVDGGLTAD